MARADSSIRVTIIGDAKSLQTAAGKSEAAVTGVGKTAAKVGGVIAGAFAVDAVFDFAQSALSEFDRVGDASGRLEEQLGDLSGPLIANADKFADIGASQGDMLELEARIADIGTAAGIADEKLAPMAESAAETAAAMALITDTDAATWADLIAKAASGATKPLKELGINLSDAEVEARALRDTGKETAGELTEGELASARMAIVLEKLRPRIADVTDGEADLEQRQATLTAKWETFTGKVGAALEGPLNDFLEWTLAGIDGLGLLRDEVVKVDAKFDAMTGGIGQAADALRTLLSLIAQVPLPGTSGAAFGSSIVGTPSGSRPSNHAPHPGVTVNVQGGSPEVIEQSVRRAINTINSHGPGGSGV